MDKSHIYQLHCYMFNDQGTLEYIHTENKWCPEFFIKVGIFKCKFSHSHPNMDTILGKPHR